KHPQRPNSKRLQDSAQSARVIAIGVSRHDVIDKRRIPVVPLDMLDNRRPSILVPGVHDVDMGTAVDLVTQRDCVPALWRLHIQEVDLEVVAHADLPSPCRLGRYSDPSSSYAA